MRGTSMTWERAQEYLPWGRNNDPFPRAGKTNHGHSTSRLAGVMPGGPPLAPHVLHL